MKRLFCSALLAFATATSEMSVASAFWPGTVVNVASNDVLNIRKWPSASSAIIDIAAPNAPLSLTGRCKNIKTNVSFQIDGPETTAKKYSLMKRANVWCQVMTPGAQLGWARGSFIWPE